MRDVIYSSLGIVFDFRLGMSVLEFLFALVIGGERSFWLELGDEHRRESFG